MTLECVKCWGSPRISQIPLSGSRQIFSRCSSQVTVRSTRRGTEGSPPLRAAARASGNLTVDIELELARRGVADSHGARSSMTGKPWDLPLVEVPLTREAIHDLHLVGTASHSSKQPIVPSLRFVAVPSVHQG